MDAKTTGPQLGLLGEGFSGPVTGRQTRELFDLSEPCEPEASSAETVDDRIARKFRNTPTIPLFPPSLQEA